MIERAAEFHKDFDSFGDRGGTLGNLASREVTARGFDCAEGCAVHDANQLHGIRRQDLILQIRIECACCHRAPSSSHIGPMSGSLNSSASTSAAAAREHLRPVLTCTQPEFDG